MFVEVVTAGCGAAVLPEDLAVLAGKHFGEVAVVGLSGDFHVLAAAVAGVFEAAQDVGRLGFDQVEVRGAVVP